MDRRPHDGLHMGVSSVARLSMLGGSYEHPSYTIVGIDARLTHRLTVLISGIIPRLGYVVITNDVVFHGTVGVV